MATGTLDQSSSFKTGYILGPRADFFWFLSLPFWAIAIAMAIHRWLPGTAQVSIALLITIPHHFATWIRTYGFSDERIRWKWRLFVGPFVILGITMLGMKWSPLTLILIYNIWDHQHSLMQQHGFARIYDFKAGAGAPTTRTWDFALSLILYANVLMTPLWSFWWAKELLQWNIPITPEGVRTVQWTVWIGTILFAIAYLAHLAKCVSQGYKINPIKYIFLGSSYFLWISVSHFGGSLLIFTIAHRLMHGLQYDVIVYSYIQRKVKNSGQTQGLMAMLARPRNVLMFIGLGLFYAVVYQFIVSGGMEQFGFGVVDLSSRYDSVREWGAPLTEGQSFDLFAAAVIQSAAILHYYVDSFIWKVSDKKVQSGL